MNKIMNMRYGIDEYDIEKGAIIMIVDRSTALGNPFRLKRGEKKGSTLGKYKRWLWEKIKVEDELIMEMLGRIDEDTVLACWCDEGCHAEVVSSAASWLRWLKEQGAK